MFCSKCGKEVIETDRYCSLCGQENDKYKGKFSLGGRIYGKIEDVIGLFSFAVALGIVHFVIPLFGYELAWWIYIILLIIILIILFSASSFYLGIISLDSSDNEAKKIEKKESPKATIEIENKEQHKNQKSQQTSKWKFILVGFFIFLVVKVFGSALSPMIYPEIRINGWTEEEKSLYMSQCMETAVVDEKHDPPFHRHYAALYCICTLKETKKIFPNSPPDVEELLQYKKMIINYCL